MLRDHGQAKKYYHELEGYNGRLDSIQTGILRVKLRHLTDWNEKRRQNAFRYNELLNGVIPQHGNTGSPQHSITGASASNLQPLTSNSAIIPPFEPSWTKAVYHLYVIRTKKRDELQKYLTENGIGTGLHYPIPLHLQKAYTRLGYTEGDFPISEKVAPEILSLPNVSRIDRTANRHKSPPNQEFHLSRPALK